MGSDIGEYTEMEDDDFDPKALALPAKSDTKQAIALQISETVGGDPGRPSAEVYGSFILTVLEYKSNV